MKNLACELNNRRDSPSDHWVAGAGLDRDSSLEESFIHFGVHVGHHYSQAMKDALKTGCRVLRDRIPDANESLLKLFDDNVNALQPLQIDYVCYQPHTIQGLILHCDAMPLWSAVFLVCDGGECKDENGMKQDDGLILYYSEYDKGVKRFIACDDLISTRPGDIVIPSPTQVHAVPLLRREKRRLGFVAWW